MYNEFLIPFHTSYNKVFEIILFTLCFFVKYLMHTLLIIKFECWLFYFSYVALFEANESEL